MSRILTIDDDRDWLIYLKKLLEQDGHDVLPLLKTEKLAEMITGSTPELIITDVMMPGMTGSNVYSMVRSLFGDQIPILVCSSTRMKVRAEDPLLDHVNKNDAHENLLERVRSLLTSAAQSKKTEEDQPSTRLKAHD